MNIQKRRSDLRSNSRYFKKLRWRYVSLCKHSIETERDIALDRCAKKMLEKEVYSKFCSLSDTKFAILRLMWHIDQANTGRFKGWKGWFDWLMEKGWRPETRSSVLLMKSSERVAA